MKAKLITKLAGGLLLAAVSTAQVYAVATMTIDDGPGGLAPVTIADGQVAAPADGSSGAGVVSTPAAGLVYGSWTLDITSKTFPALGQGSPTDPRMSTVTLNVSSGAAGTLYVTFSEVGYSNPGRVVGHTSGTWISGLVGTANYNVYADTGNTLWDPLTNPTGTDVLISTQGPFNGPAAYSQDKLGSAYPAGTFALTQVFSLTHASGGTSSHTLQLDSTVPEGGATLILLGVSLSALAAFSRNRKIKA